MAKCPDCNTIPVNGAHAVFKLITQKIAAGWTAQGYGTGTSGTYSATGAHAAYTTLANANAWQRLREPGVGRREWIYQRGTTNLAWRTKYSALSRFTGGAPSATVVPSAADEQITLAAGTDAAPTFTNIFSTDGSYRTHVVADTTPENGVYPFILYNTIAGTGVAAGGLFCQDPIIVGTSDAADGDPAAITVSATLAFQAAFWLAYGTASQLWVTAANSVEPLSLWGAQGAPGVTVKSGTQISSLNDVAMRALYQTAATPLYRPKGWAKYAALKMVNRAYGATMNKATDCRAYVGNYVLPFADGVDPQV